MRRFLLHPGDVALGRFAHGDASRSDARSIASHLLKCPRCRATIAFQEDLRGTARRIEVPRAPSSVLAGVLAGRAAGERAILPLGDARRPAPSRFVRVAAVMLIAGTGAVLAVRGANRQATRSAGVDAGSDSGSSFHDLFVSAGVLPRTAYASERPAGPSAPPIPGFDGTRLRPGRITFQSRWVDSVGRVTVDGEGHTDLTAVSFNGGPAWRVDSRASMRAPDGQLRAEAETLWVRRDNLAPIARSVRVAPYLGFSQIIVRQRFSGDSISGDMFTDGGVHRVFARPLPAPYRPYTTDALAPFILGAVTLDAAWRGSISIVGWAVRSHDVLYSSTLQVIGEERITLPGGICDCWKMRITTAAGVRNYWVRKSDGLGMLVRVEAPQPGKGIREVIITGR